MTRPLKNLSLIEQNGKTYRVARLRGAPRSGTNWMHKLLSLHPAIAVDGEFRFFELRSAFRVHAANVEPYMRWNEAHVSDLEQRFESAYRAAAAEVLGYVAAHSPDAQVIVDRTPWHLVDIDLPGTPAVYMLRDGRDVCLSQMFMWLRSAAPGQTAEEHAWRRAFVADPNGFGLSPERLFSCESAWRRLFAAWRVWIEADLSVMTRPAAGAPPALIVRYEELHADTTRVMAGVYRFLGLNPQQARPVGSRAGTKAGFDRAEDPTSWERKGQPGDWKEKFTPQALTWFIEETGDLLSRLGYADESAIADPPLVEVKRGVTVEPHDA